MRRSNEKRFKEEKVLSVRINQTRAPAVTRKTSKYQRQKIAQVTRSIQKDRSELFNDQHESELSQQVVGGVSTSYELENLNSNQKRSGFDSIQLINKRCQQSTGTT